MSNSEKILSLLATGPMAPFQIAYELGTCASSAAQYLRKLCAEGKAIQRGETLGADNRNKAKLYWMASIQTKQKEMTT